MFNQRRNDSDLSRFKIPPEQISMDGFSIERRGRTIYPHKGEHVWVVPYGGQLQDQIDSMRLLRGVEGQDPDTLEQGLFGVTSQLSSLIVQWDLRDMEGRPLPQPYQQPEVIRSLPADTIWFLVGLVEGNETEGEGEPGSVDSPGISYIGPSVTAETTS